MEPRPPGMALVAIATLRELLAAIDPTTYPELAADLEYLIAVAEERSWPL
jgi:hypothetical protein